MSDQLLQQLLDEVRSLKQELRDQGELGFSHGVRSWPQRIHIGQPEDYDSSGGGCAWYRWNANTRRAEVIPHEFLTGRITQIWLDDSREYKGKPNIKLMIRVESDCVYELVSSYDNLFSRSFLWGIYKSSLDCFKDPINIQVKPGWDKEKKKFTGTTWCNLNQGRGYLNRGYPKDDQGDTEEAQEKFWKKIRTAAIAKFNQSAMKNPPASFAGTIVPQPTSKSDNPNADRLKAVCVKLGIPASSRVPMIKAAIATQCAGKTSREMSETELISVRDRIMLNWALLSVDDQSRLMAEFTALPDDLGDMDLCDRWLGVVASLAGKVSA